MQDVVGCLIRRGAGLYPSLWFCVKVSAKCFTIKIWPRKLSLVWSGALYRSFAAVSLLGKLLGRASDLSIGCENLPEGRSFLL